MWKFFTRSVLPNWRTAIYCTLVGLALGAGSAFWVAKKFHAAALAAANQNVVYKVVRNDEAMRTLEKKYNDLVAQRNAKERVVYKEVIKHVQNDSCTHLSLGTVRVLNAARERGADPSAVYSAAGISDEEARALTQTRREDLVLADATCALMYNRLADEHEALIEAIRQQQRNLRK